VPHVVLHLDVLLKRHCLVVKLVALQTCEKKKQLTFIWSIETDRNTDTLTHFHIVR
jgi:hypothetical protein